VESAVPSQPNIYPNTMSIIATIKEVIVP
jgi:hypothetical protein